MNGHMEQISEIFIQFLIIKKYFYEWSRFFFFFFNRWKHMPRMATGRLDMSPHLDLSVSLLTHKSLSQIRPIKDGTKLVLKKSSPLSSVCVFANKLIGFTPSKRNRFYGFTLIIHINIEKRLAWFGETWRYSPWSYYHVFTWEY